MTYKEKKKVLSKNSLKELERIIKFYYKNISGHYVHHIPHYMRAQMMIDIHIGWVCWTIFLCRKLFSENEFVM